MIRNNLDEKKWERSANERKHGEWNECSEIYFHLLRRNRRNGHTQSKQHFSQIEKVNNSTKVVLTH